jgi:hypothetical protein
MIDLVAHLQVAGDALGPVLAAPDPGSGVAPPGSEQILIVLRWIKWLMTAAAVAGGLFIAGKMVISHRRGDDTNVSALGFWLLACILLGVAPQLVDALA